jgi:hypothetical protein
MSLEFRKNNFSVSYENTFFRLVAKALKDLLGETKLEGFFSGSPVCTVSENLQLDSLLITNNHAIIIDFKNYGGTITLPDLNFEEGSWLNNHSNIVKGGSGDKNPFTQLSWQKKAFTWCYHNHIVSKLKGGDEFNPNDVKTIVCFQQKTIIEGKIPSKYEKHFFICDNTTLLDTIRDIIEINVVKRGNNPIINLSKPSFDVFKSIFKADIFDFNSIIIENEKEQSLDNYDARVNIEPEKLSEDQTTAIKKIEEFLKSSNEVFILNGAVDSGKTQLIPNLQEVVFAQHYNECELIVQSNRIVRALETNYGLEGVSSLYKSIYGGQFYEDNEQNETESEKIDDSVYNDTVPLKKCNNHDKTVFIISEAHLLSDNFYTINGTLFGTGQVVTDLINYINPKNTKRKIIFIGDPFLIGDSKNSPLSSSFLKEKFDLSSDTYLLKSTSSNKVSREALKIADKIRRKSFNELSIDTSEFIGAITQNEFKSTVEKFAPNFSALRFITYTHERANTTNVWLKNNFLKNGPSINKGDLVLFYNSISIPNPNDPFASPRHIANGDYSEIIEIGNTFTKSIEKLPPLNFKSYKAKHLATGQIYESILFENFISNPKAEISNEELKAFNIMLKQLVDKEKNKYSELDGLSLSEKEKYQSEEAILISEIIELKKRKEKGESVKSELEKKEQNLRGLKRRFKVVKKLENKIKYHLKEDINTEYFKLSNASWLRFGWAVNVYKSKSFKWENVIIEANPQELGKGEMLFRHLYTALISAKRVILKDFERINPFDKIIWNDYAVNSKPSEKKLFSYDLDIDFTDQINLKLNNFIFPEEKPELKKFFANAFKCLSSANIEIERVSHPGPFSEEYAFVRGVEKAKIIISYNKSFEFKLNTVASTTKKEFAEEILEFLYNSDNTSIKPTNNSDVLKLLNDRIKTRLIGSEIAITNVTSKKNCEVYSFQSKNKSVILNIFYGSDGFFTTFMCQFSESDELLNELKEIILKLKEE